jgi:hypothetical protein
MKRTRLSGKWKIGREKKKAALLDMNKLRVTGFERSDVFVIRCAKHPRRVRPAINGMSNVSELYLIDEFPNRTSAA